jgi:hypothetical protein
MAVLKYYNTATSAWEYIAASTTANFTTWKKTMAGGETSVSGTDDNGVTLSYTVGLEQVFINGALQARGSDYTATTGTTVTGLSALGANDIVSVVCYAPFNVANTYTQAQTDSIVSAAPGLKLLTPTSVTVGSGSASVSANGGVTFTGATSVQLNGVFNSTYDNYKIVVNADSFSGNNDQIATRFGTSGTPNSNASYDNNGFYIDTSTPQALNVANNGFIYTSSKPTARTTPVSFYLDIFNPFKTLLTNFIGSGIETGGRATSIYGTFDATTSFTDVIIFPNTNNMTGTIQVYGYKD